MSSNDKFERDFEAFLNEGDPSLSALYRKLPQAEPDPKLDAAVLAMAHRALNPQLVATPSAQRTSAARRRARWIPALSAAATAVFAIGVAIKLGPHTWTERHEAPAAASAHDDGVVHVRTIDAPKPAPEPPVSPPPPSATGNVLAPAQQPAHGYARKPAPVPAEAMLQKSAPPPAAAPAPAPPAAAPPPIATEAPAVERQTQKKVEDVATPAPQAFPPAGSRSVEMDAVERKQAIAEGAWQRLHENDAAPAPEPAAKSASAEKRSAAAPLAPERVAPATAGPQPRAKTALSPSSPTAGLSAQQAPAAPALAREVPAKQAEATAPVAAQEAAAPTQSAQALGTASGAAAPATPRDEAKRADAAAAADKEEAPRDAKLKDFSAQTLRNSHLYPESWVAEIQRLIRTGHEAEAHENLTLFREKYPQYRLPADVERFAREAR